MQVLWQLERATPEEVKRALSKAEQDWTLTQVVQTIDQLRDKGFVGERKRNGRKEYFPSIELTKAEEQIMQVLWQLRRAFVKDVIAELPGSKKPAYNTVSTIIRILEDKGFVGHKAYGKTHEYFPLVEKNKYSNFYLRNFMGKYFNGSFSKMVSFFVKQNDVDVEEFEELMKYVQDDLKDQQSE